MSLETSFPSFFKMGEAEDSEYKNLRDETCFIQFKSEVERDWQLYCQLGLQDSGYKQLDEAKKHFQGVFWEMILARVLNEQGYSLTKPGTQGEGGPDYSFESQGKTIHIEATAPTSGNTDDSPSETVIYQNDFGSVTAPNEYGLIEPNKFLLRLTNSLSQKSSQYENWLSKNSGASNDCYVIAINGKKISSFIGCSIDMPYVCQALFGIGDPVTTPDGKMFYQARTTIHKSNGSPVSTASFIDNNHKTISGVLYSDADAANRNQPILFISNPNATNTVPEGIFDFARHLRYMPAENGFSLTTS